MCIRDRCRSSARSSDPAPCRSASRPPCWKPPAPDRPGGTEMRRSAVAAALVAAFAFAGGPAATGRAEEATPEPPHQNWSFDGVFGTYDRAALQRGFQVYKDVCSACHAVKHLAFRDLVEIGYNEDQVK